jgi:hypothetical protein
MPPPMIATSAFNTATCDLSGKALSARPLAGCTSKSWEASGKPRSALYSVRQRSAEVQLGRLAKIHIARADQVAGRPKAQENAAIDLD